MYDFQEVDMAQLYYRYSTMNAGKSIELIRWHITMKKGAKMSLLWFRL